VMMATLVVGPFYLSRGLGLAIAVVGLALSVGPLVSALSGVPAGRLVDRFGAERLTIAGLTGIAVGAVLVSLAPARLGIAGYLAPLAMMTASYALFQAANNTALMTGIAPDQRGAVAGMLSLSRNLGLITGASAMGALFALATRAGSVTTATPDAIRLGMRTTFAIAALLIGLALAIALGSRALVARTGKLRTLTA
jgi:MFS family permease